MFEFLPRDVVAGLHAAQTAKLQRRSRLRVQVGDKIFPVLKLWDDGLMLEADLTTHLHGLVNVYDGARHILECLIVASEVENGQLVCSFKRSTLVENKAPLDYFEPRERGVALLPKF